MRLYGIMWSARALQLKADAEGKEVAVWATTRRQAENLHPDSRGIINHSREKARFFAELFCLWGMLIFEQSAKGTNRYLRSLLNIPQERSAYLNSRSIVGVELLFQFAGNVVISVDVLFGTCF